MYIQTGSQGKSWKEQELEVPLASTNNTNSVQVIIQAIQDVKAKDSDNGDIAIDNYQLDRCPRYSSAEVGKEEGLLIIICNKQTLTHHTSRM